MLRKISVVFAMLFLFVSVHAQVFTSSNHPIIVISTKNNAAIPDEPGVAANMKIIYRGAGLRNYLFDQYSAPFLNYDGNIDIELRGSYSQTLPKKGYGFTTLKPDNISNDNVSLLGMPAENDWVLNSLNYDPSLIRDFLGLNLSRQMGQYASRTAFCEVVVNSVYMGLYLLQEKIKVDKNRVNIVKMENTDNELPQLSGGYIVKTDKPTGGDPIAWTMASYNGNYENNFIHSWPRPEDITFQQSNYIKSLFFKLQSTTSANNSSISNGYPSIIDIPSFVDFILLNELIGNVDAYTFSTYYSKDRSGKIKAGPVWDLNLSMGNDLFGLGFDRSKTNVWQFSNFNNEGPKYFRDLFNSSPFKCYLSKRWNELIQPGMPWHLSKIESLIDSSATLINEAKSREEERWGTIGMHQDTIKAMKTWFRQRIPWMSSRLGSYSACLNVSTPPLVISRINYHPAISIDFPENERLEFVEITNTGVSTIDLSGIYFGGTGLVFQFPMNASLPGGASIILASDVATFKKKYGVNPYGQFSRNLPNSDYNLVLSDPFGNVIDEVHYYDKKPWPNADGNGFFLQLIDKSLDNALASSWIAVGENTVSTTNQINDFPLEIYPNPAENELIIVCAENSICEIMNTNGQILKKLQLVNSSIKVDISSFSAGMYLISIKGENGITIKKFIKK